jgi:hypothetical protein
MEDSGGRRWRIAVGVGIGPGEAAEEGYPALLVWVGGGAAIGERDRDGEMGRTGDQKKKSMMPTDHRNLWGKRKEKMPKSMGQLRNPRCLILGVVIRGYYQRSALEYST